MQHPVKIVVCDDNWAESPLFEFTLRNIGIDYELEWVDSGLELLICLTTAEVLPDIIFLDVNMPGKSGIQWLEEIRSNRKWNHIPIIIQSFSGTTRDVEAAFSGGADLFILKSDFSKEFEHSLSSVFQRDWTTRTRPRRANFFLSADH
jgi:CheY-like chemotaxis protein